MGESIGKRIRDRRIELGYTKQLELAKKLNVEVATISKWETDKGIPDTAYLGDLASVLDTTIDWILTGKEVETKTIVKTPKEMLFDTDDIQYLSRIEENDLSVRDIYKHELVKTFQYLVDNKKIYQYLREAYNNYTTEILYLSIISNRLDKLGLFGFNDIGFADKHELTEQIWDAIVSDNRVSDETKEYILTIHCRPLVSSSYGSANNTETYHKYGSWQIIYPQLLDRFIQAKRWEWAKKVLDITLEINTQAVNDADKHDANGFKHQFTSSPIDYYDLSHGSSKIQILSISYASLEALLAEKQYELLALANKASGLIGGPTIDEKSIELHKVKNATNISLEKKLIFEFTKDYMLDSNGLLDQVNRDSQKEEDREQFIDDFLNNQKELYRKIVLGNPTKLIELTYQCLEKGDFKKIFEIAVERNIKPLYDALVKGNTEEIVSVAKTIFVKSTDQSDSNSYGILGRYILVLDDPTSIPSDAKKALKYIKGIKEEEFNKWVEHMEDKVTRIRVAKENKEEYERIKKEITPEFLMEQIAKGNEEGATIKLCVRLESILKHKFGYSGELYTMLDSLFNGPLKQVETSKPWDDEDNNYYSQMEEYNKQTDLNEIHEKLVEYLSKLRMKRNNLVHAEKSNVTFTTDDLKRCINIVEQLDN